MQLSNLRKIHLQTLKVFLVHLLLCLLQFGVGEARPLDAKDRLGKHIKPSRPRKVVRRFNRIFESKRVIHIKDIAGLMSESMTLVDRFEWLREQYKNECPTITTIKLDDAKRPHKTKVVTCLGCSSRCVPVKLMAIYIQKRKRHTPFPCFHLKQEAITVAYRHLIQQAKAKSSPTQKPFEELHTLHKWWWSTRVHFKDTCGPVKMSEFLSSNFEAASFLKTTWALLHWWK